MATRLTEEQREKIVRLYQEGFSMSAIATRFYICNSTVWRLLNCEGVKRRKCKLSEEQQGEVVRLYDEGLLLTTIADMFRVSKQVITNVLKREDRKRSSGRSARELTEKQQEEIVKMYQQGMSLRAIAGKSTISYGTARRLLQQKGIELRPRIEAVNKTLTRYKHDETFFDVIDTEEKAYWIGFIMADGHVEHPDNTDLYVLHLGLKLSDRGHITKLKASLKSSHQTYNYKLAILRLHSKGLCKALIRHGVVPRKSYEELVPPQMPNELLRHFWRGYFDGDGSLCIANNGKRKDGSVRKQWCLNLLGSRSLLESFINWAWSHGLLVRRPTLHSTNPNCKTLEVKPRRKTEVIGITQVMYEGASVYLDRKMEKYLQLKSSEANDGQLNLPLLNTKTTK